MKNTNDAIIKKYIKKVLKYIPSPYQSHLNNELQDSLYETFHDSSDLTEVMIHERFGTPEHFAAEYLSGLDADKLQFHISRTKKQKRFLAAVLVILLLSLIPLCIWICNENERHIGYYYIDEVTDHSSQ